MNRTLFELKRVGLGAVMQSIALWAVILLAAAGGIFIGYKIFGSDIDAPQPQAQESLIGIEPDATRNKLRELSTVLVAADKKGDAALANTVFLHIVAMRITMENQPAEKKKALYNCTLAAKHLSSGSETVKAGYRWLNEDQFQSAVGDCRA